MPTGKQISDLLLGTCPPSPTLSLRLTQTAPQRVSGLLQWANKNLVSPGKEKTPLAARQGGQTGLPGSKMTPVPLKMYHNGGQQRCHSVFAGTQDRWKRKPSKSGRGCKAWKTGKASRPMDQCLLEGQTSTPCRAQKGQELEVHRVLWGAWWPPGLPAAEPPSPVLPQEHTPAPHAGREAPGTRAHRQEDYSGMKGTAPACLTPGTSYTAQKPEEKRKGVPLRETDWGGDQHTLHPWNPSMAPK